MAKQLGWLPKLRILEEEIGEEEAEIERLKNPPPLFPPEREITMWAAPSEPWWSKFGRQMKEQYQPAWLSPQERKELGVEWWQNPRLRRDVMFAASEMALPVPLLGNVSTRALRQLAPTSKALKAVTAPAVFAEELPGKALGALGRTLGRGARTAKAAPQRGAIGKVPEGEFPFEKPIDEMTSEELGKLVAVRARQEAAEEAAETAVPGGTKRLSYKEIDNQVKKLTDDIAEAVAEWNKATKQFGEDSKQSSQARNKIRILDNQIEALRNRQKEIVREADIAIPKAEAGMPVTPEVTKGKLDMLTETEADYLNSTIHGMYHDYKAGEPMTASIETYLDKMPGRVLSPERKAEIAIERKVAKLRDKIEELDERIETAESAGRDTKVLEKQRQLLEDETQRLEGEVISKPTIPKAEAGIAPQAPRPVEAAAKPLTEGLTPPPPPEVPPVAKMLPEEADDLIARFVKIIKSPKAEEAWELTKELRRPIHARRFAAFGDEYRRLVDQGMAVDEAIQKATVHLKGKYPLQSLSLNDSPELSQALFTKLDKVARETNMLEGEVIATAKALEDALKRGNIPRTPGVKGGSAYTRLLKVFDKEVVDILDKPGKLVDILLGPVEQIDREALDALAKLPDIGQQLPMIPVGKRAKVLAALQKAGVNIIESFNLVRAFRSSYDLSMPFRQGLVAGVRHPVNWLRAWKPMVKALVNEDFATAFNKSLTADADVAEAVAKDWLDMISLERAAPYMKRLESFASRWAESIPGVRQSQRAAATFVNALMVDNYKAGVNVLRKAGADSSEFKAFAELVNISVGRGSIPKFVQRFAPTLNALLFSPRLLAARLELPFKLASSSPMVRKEAAKTMVSLLGFGALVLGLFKMAGGKPEFDPRGTEVGKVRIGNTRLDFWGGYIQYVRFMGQLLSGKRKTTEGTIQEVDRARLIARFFQSKEAPMLSLFTDLISGETFSGEKVRFTPKGIGKLAYENLAPFGISDFIEAVMEEGELGIIPGILAQTGVGAVTYGEKQKGGKIDLGGLKIPKFEEFKLRPSGSEGFDLSKLKIPKFEESKLR